MDPGHREHPRNPGECSLWSMTVAQGREGYGVDGDGGRVSPRTLSQLASARKEARPHGSH